MLYISWEKKGQFNNEVDGQLDTVNLVIRPVCKTYVWNIFVLLFRNSLQLEYEKK